MVLYSALNNLSVGLCRTSSHQSGPPVSLPASLYYITNVGAKDGKLFETKISKYFQRLMDIKDEYQDPIQLPNTDISVFRADLTCSSWIPVTCSKCSYFYNSKPYIEF